MTENGAVSQEIVDAGFESGHPDTRTGWPEPSVYLQWKGTDVCLDFHCECGAFCHFDGDFAYTVKCPHCMTVWEMPSILYPRKVRDSTYRHWRENPKMLDPDGDFMDEAGNALPVSDGTKDGTATAVSPS